MHLPNVHIVHQTLRNVRIIRPLCLMCILLRKHCIMCTIGKFFTLCRCILPDVNIKDVSDDFSHFLNIRNACFSLRECN